MSEGDTLWRFTLQVKGEQSFHNLITEQWSALSISSDNDQLRQHFYSKNTIFFYYLAPFHVKHLCLYLGIEDFTDQMRKGAQNIIHEVIMRFVGVSDTRQLLKHRIYPLRKDYLFRNYSFHIKRVIIIAISDNEGIA